MAQIALLGYGRFGRALAGLLNESGLSLRAMDPHQPPPDAIRADSLAELCADATTIVIAVPVPQIETAAQALLPHLASGQTVIDVGSVKVGPETALRRVFGDRFPWLATHPLFGPASLARGERPLDVVLCPNPQHPHAFEEVAHLYRRIGCSIIELDAEAHDRAMADTHALAFFVAKGLIDLGADSAPFAPPSFRAMASTIAAVRSDAGHLFAAIERENQFASASRRRLIDALENIDEQLASSEPGLQEATLAIPDLGARAPDLLETRELIDELDREIVTLLARRTQLARRAARAKAEVRHGVRDPERERALLAERRVWATEQDLDGEDVAEIFIAILRASRRTQRRDVDL